MKHWMSTASISMKEMDIKTKGFDVCDTEEPHWYDINSLRE